MRSLGVVVHAWGAFTMLHLTTGLSAGQSSGSASAPSAVCASVSPAPAAPPSSNTGVQSASGSLSALVDWASLTFSDAEHDLAGVLAMFGGEHEWSALERGANGYRAGWVRGAVKVLYDGQPGMGIHVQLSGKGCRQLEAEGLVTDWQSFVGWVLAAGGSFSRLDLALDDRAGLVNLDLVEEAVRSDAYVSRWRSWRITQSKSRGAAQLGRTVNFGAPQSDASLRIYDKAAEQGVEGPWVRLEMQMRDDRAQRLALALSEKGAGVVAGVLRGYLDFKQAGEGTQKTRWRSAAWWSELLAAAERVVLGTAPLVRTVASIKAWVSRQVAPSLAILAAAATEGRDAIDAIIELGFGRLRPDQWRLAGVGTA